LRHLKEWGVNFLNEDYENALFYVELSIYVSIAIHFIFILYDNRWFKNLLQGVSNIFGALAIIMVYVIFPFIIENESWVKVIRIALLVLFVLSIIGALAEIIKGFRNLARDPGRI
jgi:VIT1/CCC1 family predicted Fe2+/Mn2+ transporter